MGRTLKKLLRAVANYDPDYYDMHADANEALFATLYVEAIAEVLDARNIQPPATFLEAGCQAGRLVAPFAKIGYRVTGIDRSGFALRRAEQNLKQLGTSAEFVKAELTQFITSGRRQFDVVLCAEVIYLADDPESMLRTLGSAVKPGGLLCVSHRLKSYYLFEAVRKGDLELAHQVLHSGSGSFTTEGEGDRFNWQTPEELEDWYARIGFRILRQTPIDRYAWLTRLDLEQLDEKQKTLWKALESETRQWMPGLARYQLVIATPEAA